MMKVSDPEVTARIDDAMNNGFTKAELDALIADIERVAEPDDLDVGQEFRSAYRVFPTGHINVNGEGE